VAGKLRVMLSGKQERSRRKNKTVSSLAARREHEPSFPLPQVYGLADVTPGKSSGTIALPQRVCRGMSLYALRHGSEERPPIPSPLRGEGWGGG